MEMCYNTPYIGNVSGSAFFEDKKLIWHDDGLGTKKLNIFSEEGEVRVNGFSPNLVGQTLHIKQ